MVNTPARTKKAIKATPARKKAAPAKSAKRATARTEKPKKPKEKPEQDKGEEQKKTTVSTAELAQLFGVTVRRIQQLQQEGIIRPEGKNQWNAFRCTLAGLRHYREKSDSRKSAESEEMAERKLSRETIKAEMEALKLAQIKKELHKGEDIERVMGAVLTRLRINLLAIPMGVAPVLRDLTDANEIAEKIDERIRRAMSEVASIDLGEMISKEEE